MLVFTLSFLCTLLVVITCITIHFYVSGEQELLDLQSYIRDLKDEAKKLNRKCNKELSCKCCSSLYNFNERFDFNFCSSKCDEECEL